MLIGGKTLIEEWRKEVARRGWKRLAEEAARRLAREICDCRDINGRLALDTPAQADSDETLGPGGGGLQSARQTQHKRG